ncbi:hypothetical protein ACFXDE_15740 [Kitasatospora sp. NPDC059408]|uniref:hypothetical protein n=1 Tax=Kitasatospora sp. NPDC059408 TaxID=3346823 RepID=UPI0036C688C6
MVQPQGAQGQLKRVLNGLIGVMQAAGPVVPGLQKRVQTRGRVSASVLSQRALGPAAVAPLPCLEGRHAELKSMAERIEAFLANAVTATRARLASDLTATKIAPDAAKAVNPQALGIRPEGAK